MLDTPRKRVRLTYSHRLGELAALGRDLEELEREEAKKRKLAGGKKAGRSRPAKEEEIGSGKCPEPIAPQTRDKVAEVLGISGRTYEKIIEEDVELLATFSHFFCQIPQSPGVLHVRSCPRAEQLRLLNGDEAMAGSHCADSVAQRRRWSVSDRLIMERDLKLRERAETEAIDLKVDFEQAGPGSTFGTLVFTGNIASYGLCFLNAAALDELAAFLSQAARCLRESVKDAPTALP